MIYLGPYVHCLRRPPTKAIVKVRSCPQENCKRYLKEPIPVPPHDGRGQNVEPRFCPLCGSSIVDVPKEIERNVSPYDVIGDELIQLGPWIVYDRAHLQIVYLGANHPKDCPRRFRVPLGDSLDEDHLDLTHLDRNAEIEWMEGRYFDAIAKLRTAFDQVGVLWGFHCCSGD